MNHINPDQMGDVKVPANVQSSDVTVKIGIPDLPAMWANTVIITEFRFINCDCRTHINSKLEIGRL